MADDGTKAIYWQLVEEGVEAGEVDAAIMAREHARAGTEIVNRFALQMQGQAGGFMSTPPVLTVAHIHAALALAYAGIAASQS